MQSLHKCIESSLPILWKISFCKCLTLIHLGLVQVQTNLSKDLCCQCLIGFNGLNAMVAASTLVLPAFSFVLQSVIVNDPNKRDDIDDRLHSVITNLSKCESFDQ